MVSADKVTMSPLKEMILKNICFTELVYQRINKKLKFNLNRTEIEAFIYSTIKDSETEINRIGKNYYAVNQKEKVRITINSNTIRVITADKM